MSKRARDAVTPLGQGAVMFVSAPPVVRATGDVIEISVVTGCQVHVVAMTRHALHVMTDQALAILTGNPAAVVPMRTKR